MSMASARCQGSNSPAISTSVMVTVSFEPAGRWRGASYSIQRRSSSARACVCRALRHRSTRKSVKRFGLSKRTSTEGGDWALAAVPARPASAKRIDGSRFMVPPPCFGCAFLLLWRRSRGGVSVGHRWNLERPAQPALSPDGAQACVSVTSFDMEENKGRSSLWLYSAFGGEPRRLTSAGEKDGEPRWSPDGQWIAFVAKRPIARA